MSVAVNLCHKFRANWTSHCVGLLLLEFHDALSAKTVVVTRCQHDVAWVLHTYRTVPSENLVARLDSAFW